MFEGALEAMKTSKALTENHYKLFQVLYDAPGHTLTTMEIARVMGWPSHSPVNANYGKLAQALATRMGWSVPPGLPQSTTVATFEGGVPDDPHTRWTMHPELVAALESCRIVFPRSRKSPDA